MEQEKKQLEYVCKGCTECCKTFRMPVKNKKELILRFQKHFGFKLLDYNIEVIFRGSCEHLQNNKCLTHDYKPKTCRDFICQRHVNLDVPPGQIYEKRCLVCGNMRKFKAGTERDKQSVCGNCWVW